LEASSCQGKDGVVASERVGEEEGEPALERAGGHEANPTAH